MPPRRSTRSARPSAEPEKPAPTTAAAKRKRSQALAEEPIAEKENTVKPGRKPASTRSSIAPTKPKASTRPRASLKEVEESEEEEEEEEEDRDEQAPSVKKARLSTEAEDDSDEEEYQEEEVVKPKGRKSAVKKEKLDDSDEAPPTSKQKAAKPTAKGKATATRKSTARKVSAKSRPQADSGEEDAPVEASDDDEKPAPKSHSTPSAVASKPTEDDDDSEIELMPKKKKPSTKAKAPTQRVVTSSSDEAQEAVAPPAEVEEMEESLLDTLPPSLPFPQAQAPPPADEPKGPKARLTIHKMALVNFKSYAGRQEIGPFHKAGRFHSHSNQKREVLLCQHSHSRLSLARTGLANPTPSTRCSSCLVTARRRCARGSCRNSSTTLHATPILTNAASRYTSVIS